MTNRNSHRRNRSTRKLSSFRGVESLESRTLLASATVTVAASFPNASETSPTRTGRGEFLFSRAGGSLASPLVVHYAVGNTSTATSGTDYQALSGTVTIPAGKKSVAINLIPVDDSTHENSETVVVNLTAGSYKLGTPKTATVTIADNDPVSVGTTVGVYSSFPNASETSPHRTGRGEFLFTRLTGSTASALTLNYYVRNLSTATSGVDFEALSGSVTIPAGKRSAAVNLFPIDDATDEPTESVILVVQDGTGFTVVHRWSGVNIADNDDPIVTPSDWFGDTRNFRKALNVDVGAYARVDQPVDQAINFTSILSDESATGSLVENSIKVVEVSADGSTVIDSNVPYQFDKASGYNALSNASGNLVILAKGSSSASAVRHYQVYFDVTGSFSAPSFTSLVTTTDGVTDEGQSAIEIDTQTATYFLQKQNGGFSSILDKSNNHNDWLSFDPASNSHAGGEFRGTPNAVFPGGGFHAGFTVGSTSIIYSGPLKTTIESTVSVDKQISGSPFTYKMRYEIYPTFVRATMVQADDSYWFLYEGTPGGSIDSNDSVVRSDGTSTDINTAWDDNDGLGNGSDAAASNGDEWAYFADSGVGKFIFFTHNTTDNLKDSYVLANDNGQMTVFGFGRDNSVSDPDREKMTAQNNSFTFGIANGGGANQTEIDNATGVIDGLYKPVSVTLGSSSTKS